MKRLVSEVLRTLFPPVCPLCGKNFLREDEAICPVCMEGFHRLHPPFCRRCGVPMRAGPSVEEALCGRCLLERKEAEGAAYRVRSAAVYTDNLRRAILRTKYSGSVCLAASLGRYLDQQMDRLFPGSRFHRVVPVPLHPKRTRERGFNQCILLARSLAGTRGIFLDDRSVKRVRHTGTQTVSHRAGRKANLRGAFRVKEASSIRGESVLVVDDVYTTGATMESLAHVLLTAGACSVAGLTLARSPAPGALSSPATTPPRLNAAAVRP